MTKFVNLLKMAACILVISAGNASAVNYTDVPGGANTGLPLAYFGNTPNPSGDSPEVSEVFSLPSDFSLSSFSFYALGNTAPSVQLNVAKWNPTTNSKNQAINSVGPALLTTANATFETYNSTGGFTTFEFDNLGLNLSANTKYIAYLTSNDPKVTGIQLSRTQTANDTSGFGIGNAYFSTIPNVGWTLPFSGSGFLSLQYSAVAAPVPEPTTSMMFLAGLLGIGALLRRRNSQS
ncbi:hypothetical protein AAKU67_002045 [Oxalobacteraceae bacterium GrIS 2.11]